MLEHTHSYYWKRLITCASLCFLAQATYATNYYTEHKISLALQNTIDPKEIVWLKSNPFTRTLGLYKDAQGKKTLGTALILADLSHHPDWPQIINPLRNNLPAHGWQTFSIHMPEKMANASAFELENIYQVTKSRITSAINHLTTKGSHNIVIIARRHSANIAIKYLVENEDSRKNVTGFVGISIFDSPWINTSQLLRKMPIPYLDIFAQYDTPEVLISAPKRLMSAKFSGLQYNAPPQTSRSTKVQQLAKNKTGNLYYRQTIINSAHSHFSKLQHTLIKSIRGWLKSAETSR